MALFITFIFAVSEQKPPLVEPLVPLEDILERVKEGFVQLESKLEELENTNEELKEVFWWQSSWRKFVREDEHYLFSDWIFKESWE